MSVSNIPESVKLLLWGKSGGRCQYEGCSKALWRDDLTKAEFNAAYIAHIIADKPTGPRGHSELSEKLSSSALTKWTFFGRRTWDRAKLTSSHYIRNGHNLVIKLICNLKTLFISEGLVWRFKIL